MVLKFIQTYSFLHLSFIITIWWLHLIVFPQPDDLLSSKVQSLCPTITGNVCCTEDQFDTLRTQVQQVRILSEPMRPILSHDFRSSFCLFPSSHRDLKCCEGSPSIRWNNHLFISKEMVMNTHSHVPMLLGRVLWLQLCFSNTQATENYANCTVLMYVFLFAGDSLSCRLSSMFEKLFKSVLWAYLLSKSEFIYQCDFCFQGQKSLLLLYGFILKDL